MTIIESCLLGFLQGLTEFLPVSSSGHLVIVETLLNYKPSAFLGFDLLLHLATLLAVCLYFRRKLMELCVSLFSRRDNDSNRSNNRRLISAILFSTFITGVIGLLLKDQFEAIRDISWGVGVSFIITGALLLSTLYSKNSGTDKDELAINLWYFALIMGLIQGFAIIPGISRSGSTVCAALFLGASKSKSVEYSFLMSIPIILIASVYKVFDTEAAMIAVDFVPAVIGFIVSLLSGIIFLWMLVWILKKDRLYQFAFYTIPLGFLVIGLFLTGFIK
jgi:undecaprenyl-diphosphatase